VCPEKAVALVLACCYLRNYLQRKNVESYYQGGFDIEIISTGEINDSDRGQTAHYLHCIIFKEGIRLVRQKKRDKSFHFTLTPWDLFHGMRISLKLCVSFLLTSCGIEVEMT